MSTLIWLVVLTCVTSLCGLGVVFFRLRRVHELIYEVKDQVVDSTNKLADRLLKQMQALQLLHRYFPSSDLVLSVGGWAASADFLVVLAEYAIEHKPAVIVECGSGTSTLVLALCTQRNGVGHVYSLEHDVEYAAKTRRRLEAAGLSNLVSVIDAPLESGWYTTGAVPNLEIDMLIIDGPPQLDDGLARYPAGAALLTKLKGVAFLDDADRPAERETVARWRREFRSLRAVEHDCEKGCVALSYDSEL